MFGKQRIDEVLEAYLLALAGRDQCPDSASPLLKHGLAENLDRAEKAYAYAVADGLEARSLPLDMATAELAAANRAAREGLHSKSMPAILLDLEQATRRALEVLRIAGVS
jgi:hypothetical protein